MALDCDMALEQFWSYSPGEIRDYLESYERRERQRTRRGLLEKHFLAQDISQHINRILGGSKDGEELLELWDFFPALFEEESRESKSRKQREQMAVYKAQMNDFVYRHNHARNGGGEP